MIKICIGEYVNDYLLNLIRQQLQKAGVNDVSSIAEWQDKFSTHPPKEWSALRAKLRLTVPKFDENERLEKYTKHSKLEMIFGSTNPEPEIPEYFINALAENLKETKKNNILMSGEFPMAYSDLTRAL